MTLPFSGPITLNDINTEFGNGASLTQNYSANLTSTERDDHPLVPASGEISLWDFYTNAAPSSGVGLMHKNGNMLDQTLTQTTTFTDAAGDTRDRKEFSGWYVYLGQFISGTSTIPGTNFAIPSDPTPTPTGNGGTSSGDGNTNHTVNSNTFSVTFVTPDTNIDGSASGFNAMKLTLNQFTAEQGFDIVRGPVLIAKNRRTISAGERVSFKYRAISGGDAFDVLGFIIDDTGSSLVHQVILDQTQNSSGGGTDWITSTVTVTTSGSYYFVFINGTFDFTGGLLAGASLFVTDVEIVAGGALTEAGGFSNVGNNPNWTSNTTTSAVTFTTNGNGINAVLNIQTIGTQAIIRVINGGSGFAVGDSITVGGQQLGGNASGDDLTFNVAALA